MVSENYLQARARLSTFVLRTRNKSDLADATEKLEDVLKRVPDYAPAHAALGVAKLQFARNGFGGPDYLTDAHHSF